MHSGLTEVARRGCWPSLYAAILVLRCSSRRRQRAGLARAGGRGACAGGHTREQRRNFCAGCPAPRPLVAVATIGALNPASTIKLVTTYAALDQLGPAYRWTTEVYADGATAGRRAQRQSGPERLWRPAPDDGKLLAAAAEPARARTARNPRRSGSRPQLFPARTTTTRPVRRQPTRPYNTRPTPCSSISRRCDCSSCRTPARHAAHRAEPALPQIQI